MKRLFTVLAAVLALLPNPAFAGGTKVRTGIAPLSDFCDAGTCNWNFTESCTTNADCDFGTLSAASKVSLAGDGVLKLKIAGVTDGAGQPVTGEYIYYGAIGTDFDYRALTIKVPLVDGKASLEVDVRSLMGAAGSGSALLLSYLYGIPDVPANCPGDNSPAEIAAREGNVLDCVSGFVRGVGGMLAGGKGGWKANLVSIPDTCGAGVCTVNTDEACTTNADCSFGALSPKSKVSIGTDGSVKVKIQGMADGTGSPAEGTYFVTFLYFGPLLQSLAIEVPVSGGKGSAAADLSTILPPEGRYIDFAVPQLGSPTATPAGCPTGNDVLTLLDRAGDPDCQVSVELIGQGGVSVE